MIRKFVMLGVLCVFVWKPVFTQNKNTNPQQVVSLIDFTLPHSSAIDRETNAVIISDSGNISFSGNKKGYFLDYILTRKTRIKILRQQGMEAATVKILLYGEKDFKDKLENLQAITYNVDNGKISSMPLNPADVFETQLGKHISEMKFTLPAVKEGSVIEYSYRIVSAYYNSLPSWTFQHMEFPCLKSSFEIKQPEFLRYVVMRNGADSVAFTTAEDGYRSINILSASVRSVFYKLNWTAKDIAAFKPQPFIYSAQDYLDRITFQFTNTNFAADKGKIPSWTSATADLLTDPDFGGMIAPGVNDNLFNITEKITAGNADLLTAAKSIYAYVRDGFSCESSNYLYANSDLYEVNRKKQGNTAELNLLLVALLRQKGLKADPVILSTREYGWHSDLYPSLNRLNYVIARLKIFGDTIYLDASRPHLGFGKLPLNCYNGHARIISAVDTGNVYLFPDNVKEMERVTVFIANDEKQNGVMSGSFQSIPTWHQAYNLRNNISKQGQKSYFKNIVNGGMADFTIENPGIDSLTRYDESINLHYDFQFKSGTEENDLLYFSPMMTEGMQSNPFTAAQRAFPVEMPAPVDKLYLLNMEIPAGYNVEEIPASAKFSFNGTEGSFEYHIQKDETNIQLRSRLKVDRAVFRPEEYNDLREFFAQVVKKQAEQIVFKRRK